MGVTVRVLYDAVGRYEAGKGSVIEITEEEFARWQPVGAVEAYDGSEGPEEDAVAAVEEPEPDAVVEEPAVEADEPVAETPSPRPRGRRARGDAGK